MQVPDFGLNKTQRSEFNSDKDFSCQILIDKLGCHNKRDRSKDHSRLSQDR